MLKANHTKEFIIRNNQNFSIEGTYKGRFVNLGTQSVIIDDVSIAPLGEYSVDYAPYTAKGTVTIIFPEATTESTNRGPDLKAKNLVGFFCGYLVDEEGNNCHI